MTLYERWLTVRRPVLIFAWLLMLALIDNWAITVLAAFALTVHLTDQEKIAP